MPGPLQSIERAAAVLRLLSHRPLGLVEISLALGLPKTTTHGIVKTLRQEGLVDQDRATSRYRLGESLLHLTSHSVDSNEIRSRATNFADALASTTRQAVRVGVLEDGAVRIVHHVFRPDQRRQSLDVGSVLPAHATALGKALLAFDVALAPQRSGAALDSYAKRTMTDTSSLRAALSDTRARGWADDVEEFTPERAGIAAPVRGTGGLVVAALGISGPVDELCTSGRPKEELARQVVETARSVSRELGHVR